MLHPCPTGQTCAPAQVATGPGGVTDITSAAGTLIRVLLDRASAAYKDLYRHRTSTARLNAQATARGSARPQVRTGNSVRTLNTLTSLVITVQARARARARLATARAPTPTIILC